MTIVLDDNKAEQREDFHLGFGDWDLGLGNECIKAWGQGSEFRVIGMRRLKMQWLDSCEVAAHPLKRLGSNPPHETAFLLV